MDPGQSTQLLSQDQGFNEGRTDEHKSLPHFSFLLVKAGVDVIPNSYEFVSATACVLLVPSCYVTAHSRRQCPSG